MNGPSVFGKVFFLLFFVISFLAFLTYDPAKSGVGLEGVEGKDLEVERVVDGDTVLLEGGMKVRLVGMNAPETGSGGNRQRECFGDEAKVEAERILIGERVVFKKDAVAGVKDKYGRFLGHIFLENGENFAEMMIRNGYAYEYAYKNQRYDFRGDFEDAQKHAEDNTLGLWEDGVCEDFD